VGSEHAGQRAALIMSLVQSARMDERDSWACLSDFLPRLQTLRNSELDAPLPHCWTSVQA
jgi:hypothetical protein